MSEKRWHGGLGAAFIILWLAMCLSGCADACPDALLKLPHIQRAIEAEPIPLYEPEAGTSRAVDT